MAEGKKDWVQRRIDSMTAEEAAAHDIALHKRFAKHIGEEAVEREERSQIDAAWQHNEAAAEMLANWGQIQGLRSGYVGIDALTKGFMPGELVILGGYTSRGKTQLAVNMAWRMVQAGIRVLFVTLEMTKPQLNTRFMRLGEIQVDTPLFYQSLDVLAPADIDGLIERAKGDGVQFVVVDHLHYFARGNNILGQVGEVTRDFKRLALKHELPILLLSQLSRPEKLGPKAKLKVPSLSDLKESSYIEQDADIVLMVHRNFAEDGDENVDPADVVVAQRKNRPRGMEPGRNATLLRHDMENGVRLFEPSVHFPKGPHSS